jgi:hypothetical protein
MTQEQRFSCVVNDMLEIIDFSDGAPVTKIEEIMMQAISFAVFIKALNILISNGLVYVDQQHIAWRVRT